MRLPFVALGIVAVAGPLFGQPAPRVRSLGQPEIWKWSVSGGAGWEGDGGRAWHGEARAGLYRDVINPLTGLAGVQLDAYLGIGGDGTAPGVRARLVSPFARFGVGADLPSDGDVGLLLTLNHPIRRGGVLRDGSTLRLDWMPGRSAVSLGLEKPVLRRIPQGRTRPIAERVDVAGRPPVPRGVRSEDPAVRAALHVVRASADAIAQLVVVFLDHGGSDRVAADQAARLHVQQLAEFVKPREDSAAGTDAQVRRYHAGLDAAFSAALSGNADRGVTDEGRQIAQQGREVLLEHVLLPYDRLLGQSKTPNVLRHFRARAQQVFEQSLRSQSDASPQSAQAASAVFAEWLAIIQDTHDALLLQWQDARFVFLPLQYALRPEEHDTQAELDALVERSVGVAFTEGNFVSYAISEQYQYQLSRTIRQAELYHVLWTHDVRGFDDHGQPDEMAFRQVLHSYLAALTDRVRAYDRTRAIPTYIILLDQWFYEVNRGRLWLDLLEDPLTYEVDLPRGFEAWEDSIAKAQAALRRAVLDSRELQAGRARHGDAWLHSLVRVHVNITNPPDATFWSRNVIRFVPLPDNMARDHRKLVFYDVTEDDPYSGGALITGAGVGEHYASLSWDERTLVVRGPALLGLKHAAHELLRLQRMPADEIPEALRPRPLAADYAARIVRVPQHDQAPLRALAINNGIGFDQKDVNIAKAILYTLMPPGSVIKIPDSLWNSMFWGGALCGAALRGSRILIIAPAKENSPVPKLAPFARGQEFLSRMLAARQQLDDAIAAAGGQLRIGLYAPEFEVTDIPAKVRAVQHTFEQHAWLRELFGFPPGVYESLGDLVAALARVSMRPTHAPEFEYDPVPKLHLKANFFASREAWTLMQRPEWGALTWEYVQQRIAQVQGRAAAVGDFRDVAEPFIDVGGPVVSDWFTGLPAAQRERVIFYTVMGSQNQNYRSMVVDAEVAFVVSGWPSVIPYLDLISLIGQSKWIEQPEQLEPLLPAQPGWRWKFGRWVKLTT